MLITFTTDKTVSETASALQTAIVANNFGLMQVHDLQATMQKKGVEFTHECLIFEVCNPHQAKKVLDSNLSLSTALPCRISLYEQDGKTFLVTLKPTMMLSMFGMADLASVAQEVETTMIKIMQAAL